MPIPLFPKEYYLNLMGITQYQLRNPAALKGEVSLQLSLNIKLIIVSDDPIDHNDPFINKIVFTLNITPDAFTILSLKKVGMLLSHIDCKLWLINCQLPIDLSYEKPVIITPCSLDELKTSSQQKKQLWQILCDNENHYLA